MYLYIIYIFTCIYVYVDMSFEIIEIFAPAHKFRRCIYDHICTCMVTGNDEHCNPLFFPHCLVTLDSESTATFAPMDG